MRGATCILNDIDFLSGKKNEKLNTSSQNSGFGLKFKGIELSCNVLSSVPLKIGSFSSDDGDGNKNVTKQ